MQRYQIYPRNGFPKVLSNDVRNESVRKAVKSVFAKFIPLCNFRIDGVGAYSVWYRGVERRVEEGDVLCFGEGLDAGFDDCEGAGVVEGCEVGELFQMVDRVLVNGVSCWVVSSVDDPVAGVVETLFGGQLGKALVVDKMA